MLCVVGEELAMMELSAAMKKRAVKIIKTLEVLQSSLNPKTTAIAKTPPPTQPAAKSFVTFTGSVTDEVTRKRVANGTPMNKNQEIVFSTDLLSIGQS
jgi:hypothetical protein